MKVNRTKTLTYAILSNIDGEKFNSHGDEYLFA